jgi:hypothetical protein
MIMTPSYYKTLCRIGNIRTPVRHNKMNVLLLALSSMLDRSLPYIYRYVSGHWSMIRELNRRAVAHSDFPDLAADPYRDAPVSDMPSDLIFEDNLTNRSDNFEERYIQGTLRGVGNYPAKCDDLDVRKPILVINLERDTDLARNEYRLPTVKPQLESSPDEDFGRISKSEVIIGPDSFSAMDFARLYTSMWGCFYDLTYGYSDIRLTSDGYTMREVSCEVVDFLYLQPFRHSLFVAKAAEMIEGHRFSLSKTWEGLNPRASGPTSTGVTLKPDFVRGSDLISLLNQLGIEDYQSTPLSSLDENALTTLYREAFIDAMLTKLNTPLPGYFSRESKIVKFAVELLYAHPSPSNIRASGIFMRLGHVSGHSRDNSIETAMRSSMSSADFVEELMKKYDLAQPPADETSMVYTDTGETIRYSEAVGRVYDECVHYMTNEKPVFTLYGEDVLGPFSSSEQWNRMMVSSLATTSSGFSVIIPGMDGPVKTSSKTIAFFTMSEELCRWDDVMNLRGAGLGDNALIPPPQFVDHNGFREVPDAMRIGTREVAGGRASREIFIVPMHLLRPDGWRKRALAGYCMDATTRRSNGGSRIRFPMFERGDMDTVNRRQSHLFTLDFSVTLLLASDYSKFDKSWETWKQKIHDNEIRRRLVARQTDVQSERVSSAAAHQRRAINILKSQMATMRTGVAYVVAVKNRFSNGKVMLWQTGQGSGVKTTTTGNNIDNGIVSNRSRSLDISFKQNLVRLSAEEQSYVGDDSQAIYVLPQDYLSLTFEDGVHFGEGVSRALDTDLLYRRSCGMNMSKSDMICRIGVTTYLKKGVIYGRYAPQSHVTVFSSERTSAGSYWSNFKALLNEMILCRQRGADEVDVNSIIMVMFHLWGTLRGSAKTNKAKGTNTAIRLAIRRLLLSGEVGAGITFTHGISNIPLLWEYLGFRARDPRYGDTYPLLKALTADVMSLPLDEMKLSQASVNLDGKFQYSGGIVSGETPVKVAVFGRSDSDNLALRKGLPSSFYSYTKEKKRIFQRYRGMVEAVNTTLREKKPSPALRDLRVLNSSTQPVESVSLTIRGRSHEPSSVPPMVVSTLSPDVQSRNAAFLCGTRVNKLAHMFDAFLGVVTSPTRTKQITREVQIPGLMSKLRPDLTMHDFKALGRLDKTTFARTGLPDSVHSSILSTNRLGGVDPVDFEAAASKVSYGGEWSGSLDYDNVTGIIAQTQVEQLSVSRSNILCAGVMYLVNAVRDVSSDSTTSMYTFERAVIPLYSLM